MKIALVSKRALARASGMVSLTVLALACGNPVPKRGEPKPKPTDVVARGELVAPPFDVKGEVEGLLLVWYDERGEPHPATRRAEVPEERRATVRVEALDLAPGHADPAQVFVADLRSAGKDGRFPVRQVEREAFESALVSAATPPESSAGAPGGLGAAAHSDVIIYGASWCGACKQAAQYFTRKGVPFVEKDIEREPSARSEMLAKAKAQGVNTGGIPVIDVRGTLLGGFNPVRIEQLLATN